MTAPTSAQWVRAAAARLTLGSRRLSTYLAQRLAAKLREIWHRTMAWLSDASGLAWAVRLAALLAAAWLLRKVGVAVAAGLARRLDSSSWLLWPALIVWIIAAWRAGHPDWQPPAAAAAEEPQPEPEEPVTLAKEHPAGPTLDGVLNAARLLGTPHVHLAALDDHLGAAAGTARRLLTEACIPISDVRMQGRGTSTGVKDADIPPLSCPSPEGDGGVVGAGQGDNSSNNGLKVTRSQGGAQVTVTDLTERRAYTV